MKSLYVTFNLRRSVADHYGVSSPVTLDTKG